MRDAGKRKTRKTFDHEGHARALTFSCFRGQPFLSGDRACKWLAEALHAARLRHQFHLWAYVFMPDHAHVLLFPRNVPAGIARIKQSIKQPVTQRAVAFVMEQSPEFLSRMLDEQPGGERAHRFWQRGGGHDRNLHSALAIWEMIDYFHDNPVEARLCARREDWRWSSAAAMAGGIDVPLTLDLEFLPPDPRR